MISYICICIRCLVSMISYIGGLYSRIREAGCADIHILHGRFEYVLKTVLYCIVIC